MTNQRQVILGLGISLDGYVARKDGSVDFLVMDPEYDWMTFFNRIDVWLMGRKTLDDAVKMSAGGEFRSHGLRTIIFSRTLEPGVRDGFEVTRDDPRTVVRELRTQPGKHLWLGGGGDLVRSFLAEDLVDRLELGVVPTLIGDGVPLFPAGFPERKFRMVEAKAYKTTGLLTLAYERAR